MRDDTTFAALTIVARAAGGHVDCEAFARAYWPEGLKQRATRHGRGIGRATAGQMRTAAGGTLALLVASGMLERHGRERRALYTVTRAGEAFLADYRQKMREREVAAEVGPIHDDFAGPYPE